MSGSGVSQFSESRFCRRVRGGTGCFALVLALAVAFLAAPDRTWAVAGKIDTGGFTAYYAAQSQALHAHLGKVVDAYADLARRGAVGPMKDVLAARGTLSACWELFLNAGDMVYVYDRIDPACEKSVKGVGELVRSGLAVVAGKIEKELQWLDVSLKNLEGQPVARELGEAARQYRETAAALRRYSVEFSKPVTPPAQPGTAAPARPGGRPGLQGPAPPSVPAPHAPPPPAAPSGTSP